MNLLRWHVRLAYWLGFASLALNLYGRPSQISFYLTYFKSESSETSISYFSFGS